MSLITICPVCQTEFELIPEHLKAYNGQVRCGSCQTIFNAKENLKQTSLSEIGVIDDTVATASSSGSAIARNQQAINGQASNNQIGDQQILNQPKPDLDFGMQELYQAGPVEADLSKADFTQTPFSSDELSVGDDRTTNKVSALKDTASPEKSEAELETDDNFGWPVTTKFESAIPKQAQIEVEFTAPQPIDGLQADSWTQQQVPSNAAQNLAMSAAWSDNVTSGNEYSKEPPLQYPNPVQDETSSIEPPALSGLESNDYSFKEPSIQYPDSFQDEQAQPISASSESAESEFIIPPKYDLDFGDQRAQEPTPIPEILQNVKAGRGLAIGLPSLQFSKLQLSGFPFRAILLGLLLLLALMMQIIFANRTMLAAQHSASKPWLMQGCQLLGCKVKLPADVNMITVNDADMQEHIERQGVLEFSSVLVNHSDTVQAFPLIELTLTNIDDEPVMSRSISPQEYLQASRDIEQGLHAQEKVSVKLSLSSSGVPVAGFRVGFRYP